jgi:hypothetical protein
MDRRSVPQGYWPSEQAYGPPARSRWPGWVNVGALVVFDLCLGLVDVVALVFGGDNCGTGTEGSNPICHAGSAAVVILGPVVGALIGFVVAVVAAVRAGRYSLLAHLVAWLVTLAGAALLVGGFLGVGL